jgi:hypothetical protein
MQPRDPRQVIPGQSHIRDSFNHFAVSLLELPDEFSQIAC